MAVEKKEKKKNIIQGVIIPGLFLFVALTIVYITVPKFLTHSYSTVIEISEEARVAAARIKTEEKKITHLPTPEYVRALYITSCVAGTPALRDSLVSLIEETELNSIVIDVKDYTGTLSFNPTRESLKPLYRDARCGAYDMREFIESLHSKGIYVIGRVTVFQDPYFANSQPEFAVKRISDGGVWKDRKGLSFTDPGFREVADYLIEISKESYEAGFDEINLDYIRFPSDGNMQDIYFPASEGRKKEVVMEEFFSYYKKGMEGTGAILSADLFGMTTTAKNDMGIGQIIERALPYFDYIAPMVYPSHYNYGWNGFADPNNYPYEIVKLSLDTAVSRMVATTSPFGTIGAESLSTTTPWIFKKSAYDQKKLRPWLQDFDYGGDYDAADVRAQIQAVYDAGLDSWMLWDPSNQYTRDALLKE